MTNPITSRVMPWGLMRIHLNGAPEGYGHSVHVSYDQMRKEWDMHVDLVAPPPKEPPSLTLSDAVRHWAQGDS